MLRLYQSSDKLRDKTGKFYSWVSIFVYHCIVYSVCHTLEIICIDIRVHSECCYFYCGSIKLFYLLLRYRSILIILFNAQPFVMYYIFVVIQHRFIFLCVMVCAFRTTFRSCCLGWICLLGIQWRRHKSLVIARRKNKGIPTLRSWCDFLTYLR